MIYSYLIKITGIVQGVGFRPYIYIIAKKFSLNGWVLNDSNGVEIHIEGHKESTSSFINQIKTSPPELSRIESISIKDDKNYNLTSFEIKESLKACENQIFISPDICTCENCTADILDPNNKRYFYPFTNCTNCGPRFSIIKRVPYDRKVTTMSNFTQCKDCFKEYTTMSNRRFHAQPNCCPSCGPKIFITDNSGKDITQEIIWEEKINSWRYNKKLINFFAKKINEGSIFAIKSLSGFHLCCTPYSESTVMTLRKRKVRKSKPFALMIRDIQTIEKFCYVNESEKQLLLSKERPIVLLNKKQNNSLPNIVAPNNNYLGVMLPSTPLQILIFQTTDIDSLIMTSGNLSGLPLEFENKKAIDNLGQFCDFFLMNNRDIFLPLDDSIIKCTTYENMIIRRGRGYAPLPLLYKDSKEILAVGGDMKNTFAISKGNYIYQGPHNGELINYESLERFKSNIEHYKKLFEINPKLIVHDLHTDYESSKYASSLNIPTLGVQHHHAHIVSCMVDNKYSEKVIGVAFDGTGYGDDNSIWGSEFFICNLKEYKRVGHLDYVRFLGGDSSLRDCYKIALSYLYNIDLNRTKGILDTNYKKTYDIIYKLLSDPKKSYPSSSMGRLFDGISSLLNLCHNSSFEGEAAIMLESILETEALDIGYDFNIKDDNGVYIISPLQIINSILIDIENKIPIEKISLRFHSTIVNYIVKMCEFLRLDFNINVVALSGGVFQNNFILNNTYYELKKKNFKVLTHKDIPTNDGGISIGQLVIAKNNF
ncbi:carbamoyltransferase HypF [Clostridium paraputrificum]|uniref:carbamoyltransferase HypF n=1 Tax=Clostridium paraputrificum TaxID=29363 RepID=UPI00374F33A5